LDRIAFARNMILAVLFMQQLIRILQVFLNRFLHISANFKSSVL
jgi:hypothetical protein